MELGVTTFADLRGGQTSAGERLRQVLAEAELADQVGLHVYGVGEHHRPDFAASAPAVVLAAAAARTHRIRLTSAATVLPTADPARVFQDFATVDLLSGGRAEVMVGRGSFPEPFALFGHVQADSDALFADKLRRLLQIRDQAPSSGVHPRPEHRLPVWTAVGGNAASAVAAGLLGLPMALAVIGGPLLRATPLVQLHRQALAAARHPRQPVAVQAHGHVATSADRARTELFPSYATAATRLARERGGPTMTDRALAELAGPRGSLIVGDPEQVADKIALLHASLGVDRVLLHLGVGTLPHRLVLRAIELLGTQVAPLVQDRLANGAVAGMRDPLGPARHRDGG